MGGNSTRKLRKSVNVEMTLAAKFYILLYQCRIQLLGKRYDCMTSVESHNINNINFTCIYKEREPLKINHRNDAAWMSLVT